MSHPRPSRLRPVVVLVVALAVAGVASAQPAPADRTVTLGLLGGVGGSLDVDEGGFGNAGFQLSLSAETDLRTRVVGRAGTIGFASGDRLGTVVDADLSFLTISGEYRTREAFYQSGIYFGVGLYELDGTSLVGEDGSDSSFGFVVGFTGEFPLSRRLAFLTDLSGHYTDLDEAQLFALINIGLGIHF